MYVNYVKLCKLKKKNSLLRVFKCKTPTLVLQVPTCKHLVSGRAS